MEPVTHVLTGICLARAGFQRKTAYAVAAMAVAAELPDIDMLWSLRGPVESFQHHRGITHTLVGLPFEAALVVGGVWAWDRWRRSRFPEGMTARKASATARSTAIADSSASPRNDKQGRAVAAAQRRFPSGMTSKEGTAGALSVRWGWLYGAVLVALLSHLLLDFTNNYGIRPFFPFDAHWYAWSIVFIFDPLLFLMLVVALVAPLLFGLVGVEVGARRQRFQGRGWAIAGLLGVIAWWGLRSMEHGRAVELAQGQVITAPVAQDSVEPTSENRDAPPQRASALAGDPGMPPQRASALAGDPGMPPQRASALAGDPGMPPQRASALAGDPGMGHPVSQVDVAPAEAAPVYLQARRTLASPDPLSPFRWSTVTDFGQVYGQSEIDSWQGTLIPDEVLTPKPGHDAAVRAAEASPLGRAYLDWSPMPYVEEQPGAGGGVIVTLSDPRFMGGWMAAHGRPALVGTVRENAQRQVTQQSMDGRVER